MVNALNEMKLAKSLCKNLMSDYYDMMSERINEYKKSPPPEKLGWCFCCNFKIKI